MAIMTEVEIKRFIDEATGGTGDRVAVTDKIAARWLKDREEAAEEACDEISENTRDSWDGT